MVEGRREGRKEWLSKGEKKGRIEEGRERKKEGRNSVRQCTWRNYQAILCVQLNKRMTERRKEGRRGQNKIKKKEGRKEGEITE